MVFDNAERAIERSLRQERCTPGRCLSYVRTWLDIDAEQPDAISAWMNAWGRHPDEPGPRGAPMFYAGGSEGHGHITLSFGRRAERTTDRPIGFVDTVPHSYIPGVWGMEYLGWAEGFNSTWIPYLHEQPDWRSFGDVFVARLHAGVQDSDSVARLRYRLENMDAMQGSGHKPGYGMGYGPEVVEAVRYWQRNVMPKRFDGPTDGTQVNNRQANQLFSGAYNVIEEDR